MDFRIEPAAPEQRRPKPTDEGSLGFGKIYSDHMFTMRWTPDGGWSDPTVRPFSNLDLSPASLVLHYGQTIFEGLKAYRNRGRPGMVNLFRAADNAARFNSSAARLDLPEVDPDVFVRAIEALIELDHEWIPRSHGTSLYVRPTMIATEPYIGLKSTHEALFYVITGPVGAYYPEGFNPVKITVCERYSRAGPGGLGAAKTAANYAASLKAEKEALGRGFTQVLWLDAAEHRYVEEVGSMNILFKIGGTVVTPPAGDTILAGITKDSVLKLLASWDVPVAEERLTIDDVLGAQEGRDARRGVRRGDGGGDLPGRGARVPGADPPYRERRRRIACGAAVRRADRHPVRGEARSLRLDPGGGAGRHERLKRRRSVEVGRCGPRRRPSRVRPPPPMRFRVAGLFPADRFAAGHRRPPLFAGTARLRDPGGPGRPARQWDGKTATGRCGRDTRVRRTRHSPDAPFPRPPPPLRFDRTGTPARTHSAA